MESVVMKVGICSHDPSETRMVEGLERSDKAFKNKPKKKKKRFKRAGGCGQGGIEPRRGT